MTANLVVVGSLNMDLVALTSRLPVAGETVLGSRYLEQPGGKGANQAYAAAKLGGDVAMIGRVGRDTHGTAMRSNLASVGCDVSGVSVAEGSSSGVAVIMVAEAGQNSIVVVPGANGQFTREELLRERHRLVLAERCLLQLEIPPETVFAAAQIAHCSGGEVILDPAPMPDSLDPNLFQCIDILTPNESEAARLVGESATELSPETARQIAPRIQGQGVGTVIIKLGAIGCLLAEGGAMTLIPAPKVAAIDATAAGDVFNAGFAVARSESASLLDACRFAVKAAAISVTRIGAQRSAPARSELD
jgi:ribokinase